MKPIIFNTAMVQAIFAGTKTQTRRVIKPQPDADVLCDLHSNMGTVTKEHISKLLGFAPYAVGDILWVREKFCKLYDVDGNDQIIYGTEKYYFAADDKMPPYTYYVRDDGTHSDFPQWKPSIHMPRAAARLFLQVKDIRAERVQDISENDAKAEGVWAYFKHKEHDGEWHEGSSPPFIGANIEKSHNTRASAFAELWNSINSRRGYRWDANPWVWVYDFERVEV
jgi:hypothetical protein